MPGGLDSEGVYLHAEDDLAAPGAGFSEMLNKPGVSISTQLGLVRGDIAGLADDIDDLAGGVSTRRFPVPFSHTGTLAVKQGRPFRNKSGRTLVIDVIHSNLGTASSSGSVTIDAEIGGTSILSGAITYTASTAGDIDTTPTTTSWADGTDLTIDIDGAGTGAADLTIGVWVH